MANVPGYILQYADGKPVPPEHVFIVLRVDDGADYDPMDKYAARKAAELFLTTMLTYTTHPEATADYTALLNYVRGEKKDDGDHL